MYRYTLAAKAAAEEEEDDVVSPTLSPTESPKEAAHKHWRKAALMMHVSHQFAQAGKEHHEAEAEKQRKKGDGSDGGGGGGGGRSSSGSGNGGGGSSSGAGAGAGVSGGGGGGASSSSSKLVRVPSKESLKGPNAMAKFRRSVSAVKASNRFARMVSDNERGDRGGDRGGGGGGGSGGRGSSSKGGRGGGTHGGKDGGGWSLGSLRRQMEAAMEQAYEQALSFQRACVFALAATLGPVVLCWLVNVVRLWACLLELHTKAAGVGVYHTFHLHVIILQYPKHGSKHDDSRYVSM